MSSTTKESLRTYLLLTLSSLFFGIAFDWFYVPNQISLAGITGIAQILNHWFPVLPIGITVIALNVPLFLLGWKCLGRQLLISSLVAMVTSSLAVDLVAAVHTFQPMDPMLASIFGGIAVGTQLGVVFRLKGTTGGTDLIARLMKLRFPWLPMGTLLMVVDLVVIVAVALVFHNLYSALYGMIALWISTTVIDKVLYGMDTSKVAYIISEQTDRMIPVIREQLDRGVTILPGVGSYTGRPRDVLMCAFKQRQIVDLKKAVLDVDPGAFLIVCDAHDVLGEGFHAYHPDDI